MLKLNTSNQNNASQFFLQKVEECNKQHSKRTISDNFNKFKLKWGFNEIKSLPQSEDVKLCFDSNFSKKFGKSKNWKRPKKVVLLWIVFYYCFINQTTDISFDLDTKAIEEISIIIGIFSPIKCQYLLSCLKNENLKNRDWSTEEDHLLLELIKSNEYGQNNKFKWANISQSFNQKISSKNNFRLGKHCRERFFNHLNPRLRKGDWSNQEDVILLTNYLKFHKRWSKINSYLEGRNDNSVKNHFYKLMKTNNLIEKHRKQISDDKIQKLIEKLMTMNDNHSQSKNPFKIEIKPQHNLQFSSNSNDSYFLEDRLNESLNLVITTPYFTMDEKPKLKDHSSDFEEENCSDSNNNQKNTEEDFLFFSPNQRTHNFPQCFDNNAHEQNIHEIIESSKNKKKWNCEILKNGQTENLEDKKKLKKILAKSPTNEKTGEMFFLERIFSEIEKINIYERKTFFF